MKANASERQAIGAISDIFRATIVDVGKDSLTVMLTGDQSKLDALINLLEDYEILELARTGLCSFHLINRSPVCQLYKRNGYHNFEL